MAHYPIHNSSKQFMLQKSHPSCSWKDFGSGCRPWKAGVLRQQEDTKIGILGLSTQAAMWETVLYSGLLLCSGVFSALFLWISQGLFGCAKQEKGASYHFFRRSKRCDSKNHSKRYQNRSKRTCFFLWMRSQSALQLRSLVEHWAGRLWTTLTPRQPPCCALWWSACTEGPASWCQSRLSTSWLLLFSSVE